MHNNAKGAHLSATLNSVKAHARFHQEIAIFGRANIGGLEAIPLESKGHQISLNFKESTQSIAH
jgi:hypothetical protein